jgi:hypothetical protein
MRFVLNIALLAAFSLCYMEWGGNNSACIAQIEFDVLFRKTTNWQSLLSHPITLMGLLGQLGILISSFRIPKQNLIHIICSIMLSLVVALILLAALLSANIKMIASTAPFILLLLFYYLRKE